MRINLNSKSKKKIILTTITIVLFIIVLILIYLVFYKYVLKRSLENSVLDFSNKNEETIFEIKDITFFSTKKR